MPFDLLEKYILMAEEKIGASLPSSYRNKMMSANGGTVSASSDHWTLHPILDSSDRKRIARTCNDILRETASMKDWVGWPENAIAIAANGGGDALVFLVTGGKIESAVHRWDHETGNIKKVAGDFQKLRAV